eukprot:GFKZ01003192.1.p1 GENE.GFKZ01003192.1~~GFKZ01003192.1.p1  ORF type:complete len:1127 (-),score=230.13 GFKZ01003192.1:426-3806(-)
MEFALARPILKLQTSAEAFGARMQPPLDNLRAAVRLASAIESASPRLRSLIHPLHVQLDTLEEASDALASTDVLYHHIALMSAVASALACVTIEDGSPVEAVEAAKEAAAEPLGALRGMSHGSNEELAVAAEGMLDKIMDYVKENMSSALSFEGEADGHHDDGTAVGGDAEEAGKAMAESVTGHTAPHLKAYRENVLIVVDAFEQSAKGLGGVLALSVGAFCEGLRAVYDFIVKASQLEKKPAEEDTQAMLEPIIACMTKVAATGGDVSARDPLFNHVKAVEDANGMISWIVADSKPTSFISDAESTADFYLNKVLVATKKEAAASSHKAFVEGLRSIFKINRDYIKEFHTMGLKYGAGLEAKDAPVGGSPTVADVDEEEEGATYVTAFQTLIDGPLVEFVEASSKIGGEVAQQAKAFAAAWKAEKEFLAMAYAMDAPDDVQPMLAPIAAKMADVSAIVERVDPRGPFAQHCNAVGESVAALGWVAVDEKATAYVGDMAAAGQFFMDKVKMGAKKTDKPDTHRAWAKSLETLFAQLKAYVKEYHTQKLVWNPPKVPKVKSRSATEHEEEDSGASDYASAFKEIINGPLAEFIRASNVIGGEVAEQAAAFAGAWNAEAEFLAKAVSIPKPDDIQDMLAPIASKMGEVAAVVEKVGPRGPLSPHCNAIGESVAALGWVAVDEKATAYVGDMAGAGQFFLDKVKMGAKKSSDPGAHRAWTAAVEKLFADLKAYVKEYHTQKLVWNPPKVKRAMKTAGISPDSEGDTGNDYVKAFKALIEGPLAAYVKAASKIGGQVSEQAASLEGAWKAEGEFLAKAFNMPKADDIQEMLAPIAAKMGEVSAITEKLDPRGPLTHHCTAVSESIAALGWVAVDEKATSFVGDMAGAGQFFIDKVKMSAKKAENPDYHRDWAKSLESLYAALKAYVKEFHTQKLVWNPPKIAKSARKSVSPEVNGGTSGRPDSVTAFKNLVSGPLAAFVQTSTEIGGEVRSQALAFEAAWKAEAEFLEKASKMAKPDDFQDMLTPIASKMGEVGAIAEKVGPREALSQHCQAVGESVAALGWVAVDEKATSYVGDMAGAGQFFVDKVKMGARKTDKPDAHRAWAKSLETLFVELKAYVKEYHTQKLVWNK